jgi:putative transposase
MWWSAPPRTATLGWIAKALRPVYTALTEAARERFDEFTDTWGNRYPAIVRLWRNAWSDFVPFLARPR